MGGFVERAPRCQVFIDMDDLDTAKKKLGAFGPSRDVFGVAFGDGAEVEVHLFEMLRSELGKLTQFGDALEKV